MSLSAGKIIGVVVITCALLLILIIVVWYKVRDTPTLTLDLTLVSL
jgi:hypothetical protein